MLEKFTQEKQDTIRKFLHAVQVLKNVGEREAEEELEREFSGSFVL